MTYIMDSGDEGRRIELKTDRGLTCEGLRWAGVASGSRVLDLGCAAGTTCRLMAGMVGDGGRVVGVDASRPRLDEGLRHPDHRGWIEYRHGDAAQVPAPDGEFDVSWSRFLFEYLRQPEAALAEMVRVTKPSGTVCVGDVDGNCIWHSPCEPYLQRDIDQALRTLADGFNPRAGLALYKMFVDAGLRNVEVNILPYHVIAGPIDAEREQHWLMKLEGVVNALKDRGWSADRAEALSREFMAHLRDARTFTYSTLITVRGTRS